MAEWLGFQPFTADPGSFPGQGTEISQALRAKNKIKSILRLKSNCRVHPCDLCFSFLLRPTLLPTLVSMLPKTNSYSCVSVK